MRAPSGSLLHRRSAHGRPPRPPHTLGRGNRGAWGRGSAGLRPGAEGRRPCAPRACRSCASLRARSAPPFGAPWAPVIAGFRAQIAVRVLRRGGAPFATFLVDAHVSLTYRRHRGVSRSDCWARYPLYTRRRRFRRRRAAVLLFVRFIVINGPWPRLSVWGVGGGRRPCCCRLFLAVLPSSCGRV